MFFLKEKITKRNCRKNLDHGRKNMKTFDWKTEEKNMTTSAEQLRDILGLTDEETKKMGDIIEKYPLRITPYYLSLIDPEKGESDPIRRMSIPSISEQDMSGSFDTSGESSNTKVTGLQHKYHQTALILSTSMCAMYCRHCFRKRLVGGDSKGETRGNIPEMAEYVKSHPEITNVLISGGDALCNTNDVIREYLDTFSKIDSLDLIRIGSRIPVVLPERIYGDEELLLMLKEYCEKKQIYFVTQFNHPAEITEESIKAVTALKKAGLVLRNQTVLLKGVNDDPETLADLFRRLTAVGIIPYYVFQCRPVIGVKGQFQVPIKKGIDIVQEVINLQNGQGRSVRYCMSHPKGKIQFIGKTSSGRVIMKFHQAKYDSDAGRIFAVTLDDDACWLPEEIDYEEII